MAFLPYGPGGLRPQQPVWRVLLDDGTEYQIPSPADVGPEMQHLYQDVYGPDQRARRLAVRELRQAIGGNIQGI